MADSRNGCECPAIRWRCCERSAADRKETSASDGGARADSEKGQRHQKREEGERWNRLDHSGEPENYVPDGAAAAGDNSQRHSEMMAKKQRNAGELEMAGHPAQKFVAECFRTKGLAFSVLK